jgi:hypothetical protein
VTAWLWVPLVLAPALVLVLLGLDALERRLTVVPPRRPSRPSVPLPAIRRDVVDEHERVA